jgi:ketosteroid isomerase-like protein
MTKVDRVDDRDLVISGGLAVERSSYDWESEVVGGDEVFNDQGNFIGVWQKQADGTWKEPCIMWNSWKPAS